MHLVNLKPSPACICGHGVEYCIHFLFECACFNENRAILFNKLENYIVTIELILAGDENWLLTKTLKSSLLFILLLEAPRALTNVLAYSLQSMLFFVCFYLFLSPSSSLFHCIEHIISPYFSLYLLYYYRLIISCCKSYLYNYPHYVQSFFVYIFVKGKELH